MNLLSFDFILRFGDSALNNIRITNPNVFMNAYSRNNATTPPHTFTCAATTSNQTNWPTPTAGGSLAQVVNSGVMRAGRFFPNEPFNYVDSQTSLTPRGVDAEIAYEVARTLSAAYGKQISIQWIDVSSSNLFNIDVNLYNDNVRCSLHSQCFSYALICLMIKFSIVG